MSDEVYRWGVIGSLTPVVAFALSIPVAFVSSELALAVWLLVIPLGIFVNSRAPAEVNEYFFYRAGESRSQPRTRSRRPAIATSRRPGPQPSVSRPAHRRAGRCPCRRATCRGRRRP